MAAAVANGERAVFDTVYPAMGAVKGSALGQALGAAVDPENCLVLDDHNRATVAGIYAAGDVVSDLHQIGVAVGHDATAATSIRNDLPMAAIRAGRGGAIARCSLSRSGRNWRKAGA